MAYGYALNAKANDQLARSNAAKTETIAEQDRLIADVREAIIASIGKDATR